MMPLLFLFFTTLLNQLPPFPKLQVQQNHSRRRKERKGKEAWWGEFLHAQHKNSRHPKELRVHPFSVPITIQISLPPLKCTTLHSRGQFIFVFEKKPKMPIQSNWNTNHIPYSFCFHPDLWQMALFQHKMPGPLFPPSFSILMPREGTALCGRVLFPNDFTTTTTNVCCGPMVFLPTEYLDHR